MIGVLETFGISPNVALYMISVLGSMGIELAALVRELGAREGRLPARYRTQTYPVVRVLFALLVSGPLAVLFSPTSDLGAFFVGISAPLLFDRLSAGIKTNASDGL